MILVVVLVMVVLLALLVAGFLFMVRSSLSQSYARFHEFQARMAAEAGIQRAVIELRKSRSDPGSWYNNPAIYRQATVERAKGDETFQTFDQGQQAQRSAEERTQADAIWRFTLYAPDLNEQQGGAQQQRRVRYGITPETGKIDLNAATRGQLRRLIEAAVPTVGPNQEPLDHEALLDCLMDWKEPGNAPRSKGAKDEYYQTLRPPYLCKKARFDTVEELLQVKGFTGFVVFGEDYNRNGLLDPNENDGNASFPPDNGDGELQVGIAPYLTVFSREINVDSDNKPRINLNMRDATVLEEQLNAAGLDGKITEYIMRIRGMGMTFRSVMDLLPVPPPSEEEQEQLQEGEPTSQPGAGGETPPGGEQAQPQESQEENPTTQPGSSGDGRDPKHARRKQARVGGGEGASTQPADERPQTASGSGEGRSGPTDRRPSQRGSAPTSQPGRGRRPPLRNLTDEIPPGTYADLPVLLDRLTTDPLPMLSGRININSAGRPALAALGLFSDEEVAAIVSARAGLSGDDMKTPAWLLTQGLVSEESFRAALNRITVSSSTFSIDAVGFADHVGVVKRLGVVIEMRGPIAQVLYYRDLTPLGPAYTPHGEENRGVVSRTER